jgi:hypothetical protein
MRTREVETDAKNLIRWDYAQSLLSSALDYAMDHLEELKAEGQVEDTEGTFVTLIDDWTIQASLYLGTVFSLTPSGKYYMPFACSNVDPCPRCNGTGEQKNHKADSSIYASATKRRQNITKRYLESHGPFPDWPDWAQRAAKDCDKAIEANRNPTTCVWCGGLGSREAYLDQVWHETLEDKASKYGIFVFSGEGDPCDLFIGMAEDYPID